MRATISMDDLAAAMDRARERFPLISPDVMPDPVLGAAVHGLVAISMEHVPAPHRCQHVAEEIEVAVVGALALGLELGGAFGD